MSAVVDFKQAGQYFQAQCSVEEVALLVGVTIEELKAQYSAAHGKGASFDKWAESKAASGRALLKVARFKTAVEGNASAINAVQADIEKAATKTKARGFGTRPKREKIDDDARL